MLTYHIYFFDLSNKYANTKFKLDSNFLFVNFEDENEVSNNMTIIFHSIYFKIIVGLKP